jgi:hypothetical protein
MRLCAEKRMHGVSRGSWIADCSHRGPTTRQEPSVTRAANIRQALPH